MPSDVSFHPMNRAQRLLVLATSCASVALTASAQQAPPQRNDQTPASAGVSPGAPDPRTSIPSDTGRMQRGWHDYTRYSRPSYCVSAVRDVDHLQRAWMPRIADTAAYPGVLLRDTLTTIAVEEARRCGARFSTAAVPAEDLRYYIRLLLAANRDSLAAVALERRLGLARTDDARAVILTEMFQDDWAAHPTRIDAAQRVAARLDAMGAPARLARVAVHRTLLKHATRAFDRPAMHREIDAVFAAIGNRIIDDEPLDIQFAADEAENALRDVLLFEQPYATAIGVYSAALRVRHGLVSKQGIPLDSGSVFELLHRFSWAGKPLVLAPSIHWSPPAGATPYPRRGRVTVVMMGIPLVADPTVDADWSAADAPRDSSGEYLSLGLPPSRLAMLRRLNEKYGNMAVDFIVLRRPGGYSPPDSLDRREALTRAWFARMLPFPIVTGVEDRSHTTKPAPDGRRDYALASFERDYASIMGALVVDSTGTIVVSADTEGQISAYLDRLLNNDTVVSSPRPSGSK